MGSYNPDPGATPTGIQFTRQLSQRDLSLQIPVNFVTAPGVVLTQTCFAHGRYEDDAASKCFSNLLAIGFQRFELDIFWDATRQVWSLCPVELGTPISGTNITARAASAFIPDAISGFDAGTKDVLVRADHESGPRDEYHERRQVSSSTKTRLTGSSLTTPTSTPTNSTPTNSTTHNPPTAPTPTGGVVDVGPYSCTPSINFQAFVNILLLHLDESQTNVNATIKYLIMNLHAAAPASDPTGAALSPPLGTLPQGKQVLSYILDLSMAQYLYTPDDLADQRSDLNSSQSWYAVLRSEEPDSAYFRVEGGDGQNAYTPDGWPSASFVEMNRAKRLFAGFGRIDPQMERYNFSADKEIIFPTGYLQSPITIDQHIPGGNPCFFDPHETSVSATNNSWALAFEDSGLTQAVTAASNYTLCGISPILNKTLNGVTADQEFKPYRSFLQKTIWSWGEGQPQHSFGDAESQTANRCAVINGDSGYWETEDCAASHFSACRKGGQPYEWSIGATDTSYDKAEIPCPDGTTFSAPRTALENEHLWRHWRIAISAQNIDDELLWVNFNDLDVEGCWVVGQNVTCPYLDQGNSDRDIIVPTVAAVIVFVLAALTVFVKCAANRQRSKRRRRRGDDGWDYEGVPS